HARAREPIVDQRYQALAAREDLRVAAFPAQHVDRLVQCRGRDVLEPRHRQTSQPPSTVIDWPVMFFESSEARKQTALAMSAAVVTRRSAISLTYSWCTFSGVQLRARACSRQSLSIRSPATMPGWSAFTLILDGPTSSATVRVSPRSAHFDEEYAARFLYPRRPDVPLMLTILPYFWASIVGST